MTKPSKKILIVDDESGIVRLLKKKLQGDGRDVLSAHNGEIGFTKALEEKPDLILLDIMLPDIGGVDVVRRIQKDPRTRDIPVIFMTAYIGVETDKGDEEIEVDGKFYRAFAKPLHIRKLLSEIRKAINRRENKNQ